MIETLKFLSIYTFLFLVSLARNCPKGFDFSVGRTCYRYAVEVDLMRHEEARTYCRTHYNGSLAMLNTKRKMKRAINFFYTIYETDHKPSAWVDGTWIKGSKSIRYDNGEINLAPRWMKNVFDTVAKKKFVFPNTRMFGESATCILVSLWKKKVLGVNNSEQAGLYNAVCNWYYFTHPLCEVSV